MTTSTQTTLRICHAATGDTIHLIEPGSSLTLCGKPGGRPCPFIPVELFGSEVEMVGDPPEPEFMWCRNCQRRAGHALPAHIQKATTARQYKEAKFNHETAEEKAMRMADENLKRNGVLS